MLEGAKCETSVCMVDWKNEKIKEAIHDTLRVTRHDPRSISVITLLMGAEQMGVWRSGKPNRKHLCWTRYAGAAARPSRQGQPGTAPKHNHRRKHEAVAAIGHDTGGGGGCTVCELSLEINRSLEEERTGSWRVVHTRAGRLQRQQHQP
jgi:hypothetical protein